LKKTIYSKIGLWLGLFLMILFVSLANAEEGKKGHIYASLMGGKISGVQFVSSFSSWGHQIYEVSSEIHPLFTKAGGTGLGFALGYSYELPMVDSMRISLYAELNCYPKTAIPDGDEWDFKSTTYDWKNYSYIYNITPRKRTSSSINTLGLTLGGVIRFFPSIPVGLDFGLGYCRFSQKYLSETCLAYSGSGNYDTLGYTDMVSYAGEGWLKNNHSTMAIKLGLQFFLLKNLSLSASWVDHIYTKSYVSSEWEYVDGSDLVLDDVLGAGSLLQIGLIYIF